MNRNLTSPRARWRNSDPMAAFDRLPADLRAWLAEAALPWSARPDRARDRMNRAEARSLARDAARVWGPQYPLAADRGRATPP